MFAVGIDVGGMSIKIGLVNQNGEIIKKNSFKTDIDPYKSFCVAVQVIENLIKDANLTKSDISGVGIGFPGIVDSKKREVCFLPNLPWDNFCVGEMLEEKLNLPVKISNDANLATLAEVKFGSAKNYKSAVMFTLGTGVGGGVVIDGKLFEGWQSKGAELGHVTLVLDGERCGCGRKGCLEAYASATALIKQTKRKMLEDRTSIMWDYVGKNIDNVDGTTAFECMKKGDKSATEVYHKYAEYLAHGIINMLNVFRPEAFILGGGISNHGKYLTDIIEKILEKYHYGITGAPKTKILIAELKNDAGIIGASALFL